MKNAYLKVMDGVYWACIWIAGLSLVTMTVVIPIQVVARKFLHTGLSWPEPLALMCMIIFTFVGAAAAYRAGAHIAVNMVTDRLPPRLQSICARAVDMLMTLLVVFVIWYGTDRVLFFMKTGQTLADFTSIQVSWTYLPLPLGSAATLLFIIEAVLFGSQARRPIVMIGSHGGGVEPQPDAQH
ncbi:MAG: TRAP transporter permease DctQ [Candidatus Dactylopiibacterium carminicum]|uniref:TRAP transporter small permease protein n=1 Tax=Candidatus Dactylopiibacterium carminicum TaxID=857335 RepID=A0A272EX73_9RHOO|nr:TRAP transporter small permease [Candidatus Dactylopiibacterium carminicum]KAF7600243.1 TRAP transporter small permease [Candidatus Dactylopiibacterium carminicum]PAS94705.1 MAG: TRAP transporter permease DctQ [Candidatus Dactylopiibacterium carminicum]PAS96992.1 MAG: TRAP transporter permease DctQ [Candidatus Dactylopiibacterium carminicum]PAT00244.1 MAG: TRAP transporter small permease protein [Candidatus Dactylopiibacterium carminicum]